MAYHHDGNELTDAIEGNLDLAASSQGERQEVYRQAFSNESKPLARLAEYIEAEDDYPEFANEILDAFLTHATFIVAIWVNYDCVEKKFYADKRVRDCGKLLISPTEYRQLRRLNPGYRELSKVRLDIGTAFRTLCEVELQVAPNNLNTAHVLYGHVRATTRDIGHVINHVNDVLDIILDEPLEHGIRGLQLQDLEDIAARFVRYPSQFEQKQLGWGLNNGRAAWRKELTPDNSLTWDSLRRKKEGIDG